MAKKVKTYNVTIKGLTHKEAHILSAIVEVGVNAVMDNYDDEVLDDVSIVRYKAKGGEELVHKMAEELRDSYIGVENKVLTAIRKSGVK